MALFIIWDWWRTGNWYYCLLYKDGELYFSEAEISEEYREEEKWKKE
jgi:hypothetical protein